MIDVCDEIVKKMKDLELDLKVEEQERIFYDKDQGKIISDKRINVSGVVAYENEHKEKEIKELITQPNEKVKVMSDIKITLVGSKVTPIENAVKLFTDESVTFTHQEGEVLLLDFWATWCGPCQKPMAHNQEMLQKNADWKGKVRIVGMSLDEVADQVKERVESKGWKDIEHYMVSDMWENAFVQAHNINGIPHVVLIDKNGIICFEGHPMNTNLEEDINNLINDKEINKKSKDEEVQGKLTESNKDKFIEEIYKLNFDILNKAGVLRLNAFISKNVLNNNIDISARVYALDVTKSRENIDNIADHLKAWNDNISPDINTKIQISFRSSDSDFVQVDNKCIKCQKSLLAEDIRYFCVICQLDTDKDGHTWCESCAPNQLDDIHEHHLYFLPANSEHLLKEMGNAKIRCEPNPEENKIFPNNCDHCGSRISEIIYQCSICPRSGTNSYDMCLSCFKKSQDKEYENYEVFDETGEHDNKTHPIIISNYKHLSHRHETQIVYEYST